MRLTPVVKGVATYIPVLYKVMVKWRAGGTGGTDTAAYCYGVWLKHLTLLWANGLRTIPPSMAFSIEGRYPILDYRLVEWAVTLPPEMNFGRGWNKLLFRQALSDILPPIIQWRRSKVGFETPQSVWSRTTLRPTILHWAQQPAERLREIVEPSKLQELAEPLLALEKPHKMNEWQNLLVRSFFLNRRADEILRERNGKLRSVLYNVPAEEWEHLRKTGR